MPRAPRSLAKPRLNFITEEVFKSQFTDGGGASGTYQMVGSIPIGAEVLATRLQALAAFSGDTSAVVTVGDGSDVDRYNTGTPSVFAASLDGIAAGVPSGIRYHATAVRPTITVTSATDFTALPSTAKIRLTIAYVEF